MFPNGIAEFIAYEHHRARLAKAERIRLVKAVQRGQVRRPGNYQKVIHWLGGQMIKWGLKLQDRSVRSISQVALAGGSNIEYPPN